MTQFLLIEAPTPHVGPLADLVFEDVDSDEFLRHAASAVFPGRRGKFWSVYRRGEADLFYESWAQLADGVALESTTLGVLLLQVANRGHRFCLFWASDYADLPRTSGRAALFGEVERQLRAHDGASSLELYLCWDGAP